MWEGGSTYTVVFPGTRSVVVMARWPQLGQSTVAADSARWERGTALPCVAPPAEGEEEGRDLLVVFSEVVMAPSSG